MFLKKVIVNPTFLAQLRHPHGPYASRKTSHANGNIDYSFHLESGIQDMAICDADKRVPCHAVSLLFGGA